MTRNYEIAIYTYYQTLRTIAHYGEQDFRPTLDFTLPANIKETLARAGQLAQPSGKGQDPLSTRQPLQSIMGSLHNGEYTGYYLPRCISNEAAMPQAKPSRYGERLSYRLAKDVQQIQLP